MENKKILITGASSGIGRACAEYLSAAGYEVIGTSRNPASQNFNFPLIRLDVTDANSVKKAFEEYTERFGNLDVLINNAGIALAGPISATSIGEIKMQFETNFFGLLRVTQPFIEQMKKQGQGLIINMSSIAGKVGLPYQGSYSASKFALEGASQSLRMELKAAGIKVVLLNPGDFKTEITQNRLISKNVNQNMFGEFFKSLEKINESENNGSDPIIIAKTVEKIIKKRNPRANYYIGKASEKIFVKLLPLLPAHLIDIILSSTYGV